MSDDSQLENFLARFHSNKPGITSRMLGELPALSGGKVFQSSYHLLLATLPERIVDSVILDVACGDGYLLSLIAERCEPSCRLFGVDMNLAELQLAKNRLGATVLLRQEKSQSLSSANGTYDIVVSHLALMLMDSSDRVIAEIRRVLKPGGILSAVVGAADASGTQLMSAFRGVLAKHRTLSEYTGMKFGDPRFGTEAGLQELLSPAFEAIVCRDITLSHRQTPEQVWSWLLGMYNLHLYGETEQELIYQEFIPALLSLCDDDGQVTLTEELRSVTAKAA